MRDLCRLRINILVSPRLDTDTEYYFPSQHSIQLAWLVQPYVSRLREC